MFDFFTYAVYFILLIVLSFLLSEKLRSKQDILKFSNLSKVNRTHIVSLLLISILVGFRDNVGVDWKGYVLTFEELKMYGADYYDISHMEIGYLSINDIVIKIGGSYQLVFFIVALISWFFIFKSIPTHLLAMAIFFFFTEEYFFWSMNGVRQFVAISIFLYSIRYIIHKKLVLYIAFIYLASLFHTSILIFLPFYFLPYSKAYNYYVWLILYFVSFALNNSSVLEYSSNLIFTYLENGVNALEFYSYYANHEASQQNTALNYGMGYYFRTLTTVLIFFISRYVILEYPNTKIYFILFFIGAILQNIFIEIQIISRVVTYFLVFKPIVLAIIGYFWIQRNEAYFLLVLCALYLILFSTAIYNSSNLCSPYNFSY